MNLLWNLLLRLTLAGGITVLVLLLLRAAAGKRLSPSWKRFASAAALLFFLIPLQLPERQRQTPVQPNALMETAWPAPLAATAAPPQPRRHANRRALLLVWAGGAALAAAYHAANWSRFTKAVRAGASEAGQAEAALYQSLAAELEIRRAPMLLRCSGVGAPMLLGVVRPRLLLPDQPLEAHQLEWILRHELTHYKSGDTLLKLAALAVATLHWWNPLAYVPGRLLENDCELACDERLALAMDAIQRKRYALTILELMGRGITPLSAAFSRKGTTMKRRLESMLNAKAPTRRKKAFCAAAGTLLALAGTMSSFALAQALPAPRSIAVIGGADGPTAIYTAQKYTRDTLSEPEEALDMDTEAFARLTAQGTALGEKLNASVKLDDGALTFTIPADALPQDCRGWEIEAAAKMRDGKELPLFEAEQAGNLWTPGKTYRAAVDLDNLKSCTVNVTLRTKDGVAFYGSGHALAAEKASAEEPAQAGSTAVLGHPVPGVSQSVGFYDYYGHTGVDFPAGEGTNILAAADGTVVQAQYSAAGYGYHLIIDHGNGLQTLYGHCAALLVETGDTVTRGQKIATVGRTGNTSGYQCHFEARQNGTPVDPMPYLEGQP